MLFSLLELSFYGSADCYAGVLVICSAEPGKFNSLRQLWRILCNFACLIALGYPLLLFSFSNISLNFCGLVAGTNARVLLAFISLVVFLYHRFGKVSRTECII